MTEPLLIYGDAYDVLPSVEFDAIITDPPYGLEWDGRYGRSKDSRLPSLPVLDLRPFLTVDKPVVMFGVSNFADQLPHKGRWICWDKRGGNENADRMIGSPFELAWDNRVSGYYRIYRIMHGGSVNADGHGLKREHPTQKPINLMERIIQDYTKPGDIVFDPFMGSGTTGVAAIRTGRQFIGVEIDPAHFEVATRRIFTAQVDGVTAWDDDPI